MIWIIFTFVFVQAHQGINMYIVDDCLLLDWSNARALDYITFQKGREVNKTEVFITYMMAI
jgi:hypothetical protein